MARRMTKILTLAAALVAVALITAAPPAFAAEKLGVLVSNDDGVKGAGLDALVQALRKRKDVKVTVVAPLKNQSGTGGKTTSGTLKATRTTTRSGFPATAVAGFPADSVNYALKKVVRKRDVDLVISGINQGANLGPFVDLSGTVGAARAAARAGLPALATSMGTPAVTDFSDGVEQTLGWLAKNRAKLRRGTVQNLNIPQCASGAVRGTVSVTSAAKVADGVNPFVAVDCGQDAPAAGDDVSAFLQGFATLTKIAARPAS
jgi:5'-nucleotidase